MRRVFLAGAAASAGGLLGLVLVLLGLGAVREYAIRPTVKRLEEIQRRAYADLTEAVASRG